MESQSYTLRGDVVRMARAALRRLVVAGDPQWEYARKRMADGIPVGPGLLQQVRQIAQASAAPWLLD